MAAIRLLFLVVVLPVPQFEARLPLPCFEPRLPTPQFAPRSGQEFLLIVEAVVAENPPNAQTAGHWEQRCGPNGCQRVWVPDPQPQEAAPAVAPVYYQQRPWGLFRRWR